MWHVTRGQLNILTSRVPLEKALTDERYSAEERRKLALVLEVRAFAAETLGLNVGASYETLHDPRVKDPEREYVAFNVSGSRPDAFAPYVWRFPIVGALPYKGYFDLELAREEASWLREQGYDVALLPVPAYSTLGYFDDPLFATMLGYDDAQLVETVIHELTHNTVFIDADAAFNETLATFVGITGAEQFFRTRGQPGDEERAAAVRTNAADEAVFTKALLRLKDRLRRVYAASATRAAKLEAKQAVIADFRAGFQAEVLDQVSDPDRFAGFADPDFPLNNARILAYARYHGELDLFERLHVRGGGDLAQTVVRLRQLADEPDPRQALESSLGGAKGG